MSAGVTMKSICSKRPQIWIGPFCRTPFEASSPEPAVAKVALVEAVWCP